MFVLNVLRLKILDSIFMKMKVKNETNFCLVLFRLFQQIRILKQQKIKQNIVNYYKTILKKVLTPIA